MKEAEKERRHASWRTENYVVDFLHPHPSCRNLRSALRSRSSRHTRTLSTRQPPPPASTSSLLSLFLLSLFLLLFVLIPKRVPHPDIRKRHVALLLVTHPVTLLQIKILSLRPQSRPRGDQRLGDGAGGDA